MAFRFKKIRRAGKMERWRVNLYVLWVTQIFSMVGFNIALPFVAYFFQELGVTGTVALNNYVALSTTLPAITMAIFSPIWGKLSDRKGRKIMIIRAMTCASILLVLMGMSKNVHFFLAMRLLQGVFTGTITASMAFISANTPSNRLSYALGFMTSSNFLGFAIGPMVGGFLADIIGYRACFAMGGAILFTGMLLALFLVKEDPNSYGPALLEKQRGEGKKPKLFNKFIVYTLITLLLARMARTVFSSFIALYVQERMGTMVGASSYAGIINASAGVCTAISSVTLTRMGDTHDKAKLILLFSFIALGISCFLPWKWPLLLFALIYGIFYFVAGAIEPLITSSASEATDAGLRGQLFGMTGTINSLATIISPILAAGVSNAFSVSAVLYLIPILTVVEIAFVLFSHRGEKKEEAC